MRRIILLLSSILLLCVPFVQTHAETAEETFLLGWDAWQAQDYAAAVRYWEQAAEQGDSEAQFRLGVLYNAGIGVEQSYKTAAEYLRMAAAGGHAEAQNFLGVYYREGRGVERSYQTAAEYFRMAADQGHMDAQFNLACLYEAGAGVEQSYEKAAEYFGLAAAQGDPDAPARLQEINGKIAVAEAAGAGTPVGTAAAEGMDIPEPGEGEKLYLGIGEVPDRPLTKLYLAFLLSPNGRLIRNVTMFAHAVEVRAESGEMWLADSQLSVNPDYRFLLGENSTDIVLSQDPPLSILDLRLDSTGGTCRLTQSGSVENAELGKEGRYEASADILLANYTGDAAMNPVDPPARAEAEAAGMRLPSPGAGEALYLGEANISQAEKLYAAFTLSADGSSINGLTVFLSQLNITFPEGSAERFYRVSRTTATIPGPLPVGPEIDGGDIQLRSFSLNGETAAGILQYTCQIGEGESFPLDSAWIVFAKAE